ncbi:hypothetical protein [Mucilaginibacter terrae]|uniref:hypothetical protein n=1 Tax=Mucilaginibacter terrae TaxID=1955052 RepID=UPI00366D21F7
MTYSDVVLIQQEIFNSSLRYHNAPAAACNQLIAITGQETGYKNKYNGPEVTSPGAYVKSKKF